MGARPRRAWATKVDLGRAIGVDRLDLPWRSRRPAPASPTETSIELPWRLQISPNPHGAFAHSLVPIEHEGRYELWHSRLGVRATLLTGSRSSTRATDRRRGRSPRLRRSARSGRATSTSSHPWGSRSSGHAGRNPASFPPANRDEDFPKVRMSLNSRDRMMLVHQTSNFHLTQAAALDAAGGVDESLDGDRASAAGWTAVPRSRHLPGGALTIEEWKHRAALGRDHEVKRRLCGLLAAVRSQARRSSRSRSGSSARTPRGRGRPVPLPADVHRRPRAGEGVSQRQPRRRREAPRPNDAVRERSHPDERTPQLDNPHRWRRHGELATSSSQRFSMRRSSSSSLPSTSRATRSSSRGRSCSWSGTGTSAGAIEDVVEVYNGRPRALRPHGQRSRTPRASGPDDTILPTDSLTFNAVTAPSSNASRRTSRGSSRC